MAGNATGRVQTMYVPGTSERIKQIAAEVAALLQKPRGSVTKQEIEAELAKVEALRDADPPLSGVEEMNRLSLHSALTTRATSEGLMSSTEVMGRRDTLAVAVGAMGASGGGVGRIGPSRGVGTGPMLPRTSSPLVKMPPKAPSAPTPPQPPPPREPPPAPPSPPRAASGVVVAKLSKEKLRAAQERARLREQEKARKEAEGKIKGHALSEEDQKWLDEDERHRALAYDPADGSYKPDEARAALQAENEGILKAPVTRATDPALDFVDGNGVGFDAKSASGIDRIRAAVQAGEPALVHGTQAEIDIVRAIFGPPTDTLKYVVVGPPGP